MSQFNMSDEPIPVPNKSQADYVLERLDLLAETHMDPIIRDACDASAVLIRELRQSHSRPSRGGAAWAASPYAVLVRDLRELAKVGPNGLLDDAANAIEALERQLAPVADDQHHDLLDALDAAARDTGLVTPKLLIDAATMGRSQRATIAGLRGIVDKLPKTKDGASTAPDMEVWVIHDGKVFKAIVSCDWHRGRTRWSADPYHFDSQREYLGSDSIELDQCYSTVEAALAAKEPADGKPAPSAQTFVSDNLGVRHA